MTGALVALETTTAPHLELDVAAPTPATRSAVAQRCGGPAVRSPARVAWHQRTDEQRQQQWQATSEVAQQVMATYAVPAPRVKAWLLQVPGSTSWWQPVRSGVVVATEAASADAQVLRALLWEAFTSGLGATEA